MGRSTESVRQGANRMADRWARSARALKGENRRCGGMLAILAKKHASEAFVGCDDALEAVLFSGFVEICKLQDEKNAGNENDRDPALPD